MALLTGQLGTVNSQLANIQFGVGLPAVDAGTATAGASVDTIFTVVCMMTAGASVDSDIFVAVVSDSITAGASVATQVYLQTVHDSISQGASVSTNVNPVEHTTGGASVGTLLGFTLGGPHADSPISVGSTMSYRHELRDGADVGSEFFVAVVYANVTAGAVVGKRFASDSGDLANGRYRR